MKLYGLIGRTLKHSFSKVYFTKKFTEENISDCRYENFELQNLGEFPSLLNAHPELKGLNVTIPYKEEVIPFLTRDNEIVETVGACNCIKIDGKEIIGYNTDVVGFQKSLEPQLQSHNKHALILGTGGASKAVQYVLKKLGIDYLDVSRTKEEGRYSYADVTKEILSCHHLIINTTPLGMYPNLDEAPQIPYHLLSSKHFLFDLIYNPSKTKFLAEGEKQGAQICNGYEMLIYQAEESWRIWNA